MIRAAAIIQALLGNVGRPGGGILALRGHCSIQGSTDMPTLYNLLPGYLPQPQRRQAARHPEAVPGSGAGADRLVAQLPEVRGQPAARLVRRARRTTENGWGYELAAEDRRRPFAAADDAGDPRRHDPRPVLIGQNPVVGGSNSRRSSSRGWPNLEWLVVRDTLETETASFWYASDAVKRGELATEDIGTEVFMLPGGAAAARKKAPSPTPTG